MHLIFFTFIYAKLNLISIKFTKIIDLKTEFINQNFALNDFLGEIGLITPHVYFIKKDNIKTTYFFYCKSQTSA